jgi:hypothetical protein
MEINTRINKKKRTKTALKEDLDETQTTLFKGSVRTAL